MYETDDVPITTATSILVIITILGNSLVCAVIMRNRDMRYLQYMVTLIRMALVFLENGGGTSGLRGE